MVRPAIRLLPEDITVTSRILSTACVLMVLTGAISAQTRTKSMLGLRWHPSLDRAIAGNEKNARKARPIVWLRTLGALDGRL